MSAARANEASGRRRIGPELALALATLGLIALASAGYVWLYPALLPPAQPIAFSHRFHVANKQISCLFCHDQAARDRRAGLPSGETCLLCHRVVAIHHPQIERVRGYFADGEPVPWVRLTMLPDYVHFDHSRHLLRAVDCGRCHGDVAAMDRVYPSRELVKMGFCLDCHRQRQASIDCFTCHY